MKEKNLFKPITALVVLLVLMVFAINRYDKVVPQEEEITRENAEECPECELSADEIAFNAKKMDYKMHEVRMKSTGEIESYAGGKVKGTWSAKQFMATGSGDYGYRTIYSAYDREKDIIYLVSYAGHLWRVDYDLDNPGNTKWTSLNHSHQFMTEGSKEWLDVMNLYGGDTIASRMLRSYDDDIEYSDDEGRNWSKAQGCNFQVTGNTGCIANSSNGYRAVVLAKIDGTSQVAVSYDGINYSTTNFSLPYASYATAILKPHNSDNVYVFARNKSTNKTTTYRMDRDSSSFEELHTASTQIDYVSRVVGTYVDSVYYFYYIKGTDVYYSKDEGATWTFVNATDFGDTNGDRKVRTVHPTQPETLFRGYLDTYMSTDMGATYVDWKHKLGWDTHHMRMLQRKDSTYMHLIGNDFGVFVSLRPEDKTSYVSINNTAPTQMCYDMDISNNYGTAFTATQDRGTRNFDNIDAPYTGEIRSTDGLRVTLSNMERSVWTWMYWGSVFHKANYGYASGDKTSYDFAGNWQGGCMVESPDPTEDAIIVAVEGASKLKKITYNSGAISGTDLSFDFKSFTRSTVSSFGYSPVDPNIWYVMVKSGVFCYSTDAGVTWKKSINGNLPKGNDQGYNYCRNQQVIKASKLNANKVFIAGVNNSFFISTNHGLSFSNRSNGLNVYRIRDFELSDDEKFIYAACGTGGVWVYSVEDNYWYEMGGDDVPYVDFTGVNYTSPEGKVQFSTYGYGVLDFTLQLPDGTPDCPANFEGEGVSATKIKLSWDASSADVDGYIIKRSTNFLTYENFDTVSAQTLSYIDRVSYPLTTVAYQIQAYKGSNKSLPSACKYVTTPEITELDKSGWRVIHVDSEVAGYEKEKAIDNDLTTIWSSEASGYPHEIVIDMGATMDVQAFKYKGSSVGFAKSYEFYVTDDTLNWGSPVAKGTWASIGEISTVDFDKVYGRYVKFVALSSFYDVSKLAVLELSVWPDFDTRLYPPTSLRASSQSSSRIKLSWTNSSENAIGTIVERSLNGGAFEVIDTIKISKSYYYDKDLEPYSKCTYRLCEYRNDKTSAYSSLVTTATSSYGLVDRSGWSIISADSNTSGHGAAYVYDDNGATCWTSDSEGFPHEIQIDMGATKSLVAFSYLPPVDIANAGVIKDFEFYVSDDAENWGSPVKTGTWTENKRQNEGFESTSGRYIRLVALSEQYGKNMSSIGELLAWTSYSGTLGVSETKADDNVKVYPVPFNNHLTIELENHSDYNMLTLLSLDGKVIKKQKVDGAKINIDVPASLVSGVYFIRIQGEGKVITKKIMKN